MNKSLALFNGMLLAIMIFYNGILGKIIGPYMSTLIFHVLGFISILIISIVRKNRLPSLSKLPFILLLPGMLSVITILLNNICIPEIGITLTVGVSVYGQLIISLIVEHFGLFGRSAIKFRKEKLLGFSIISLGTIVMIIM